MSSSQFKIYNASAGSGKTFTLVKEYLKLLFKANNKNHFKHILAVTFTNKAAGEMKERIIDTLKEFSSKTIKENPNSMALAISEELGVKLELLHEASKKILQTIIHNYAAFDISTIDGFTHKVIRTFAYDLKLPLNFEVELDTNQLLKESVDSLIAKAGTNKALTKTLVDFALEKTDNDKSWDIAFDLNKIAKLLINESDLSYIDRLKDKTFEDFKGLKSQLKDDLKTTSEAIITVSKDLLNHIEECGLQYDDFSRSSLPKHFENLSNKKIDIKFDSAWQIQLINNETLYPKRVTPEIASTVEAIQPQLVEAFNKTKELVFKYKFLEAFYKNTTPLSILNSINKELEALKLDQNKLLISEFNSIISDEIKDQPTPFIYERIGEKFRHYFIDEFQDTSKLQWQNLLPLIDNSLSSENGSAMLVGDAKQAIYRWRDGEAEQFIGLYNATNNPFYVKPIIVALETNYRSTKSIVDFNNRFFNYVSQNAFSKIEHGELFFNAQQKLFNDQEGFVNLSFIDIGNKEDLNEAYASTVLDTILEVQKNGFQLSDICILIRKKKHGFALAEYLSNNSDVKIISSETLLIKNAHEVTFLNNVLKLLVQPTNMEVKAAILNYVSDIFSVEDKHTYFAKNINLKLAPFFSSFLEFGLTISYSELVQLSLYDLAESITRAFNLVKDSNAYIQFYLDFLLDFSQKNKADISSFIDHYENKKETLSIVSPEGQNAIQIMTIHKSKGLEFPVVIFPYADLDIYEDIEPKEWVEVAPEKYNGFTHGLLNYSKNFIDFGDEAKRIYDEHQAALELDSINLLYVALTRPIEQLYIISKKEIDKKGTVNGKKYSGLFINYLKKENIWKDTELNYSFGKKEKAKIGAVSNNIILEEQKFITSNIKNHDIKIVTKSALLWDTKQEMAIEKGNLLHKILSLVKTKNDLDFAISDFIKSNIINTEQAVLLKQTITTILNHPKLKAYYDTNDTIYNEREVITKDGSIIIPDRVVINSKNEAVIIDYKTGQENNKHIIQLENYACFIEEMTIKVIKKILVYINDDIQVKEF